MSQISGKKRRSEPQSVLGKTSRSKAAAGNSQGKDDKRTPKSPLDCGVKGPFFVDLVKSKRQSKVNGTEYLIGWRGYPDPSLDTWEPLKNLAGSENMVAEYERKYEVEYQAKTDQALAEKAAKKKATEQKNAAEAKGAGAGSTQKNRSANLSDLDEDEDEEEEEAGSDDSAASTGDQPLVGPSVPPFLPVKLQISTDLLFLPLSSFPSLRKKTFPSAVANSAAPCSRQKL
jgi:Chromo (CHRromatin Organisation MOdifier) domain